MWIQRSALQIVDPIVAWIFTVHGSITRCSAVLILKLLNIGVGLQYGAWIYHLTGTGSTALANPSLRLPTLLTAYCIGFIIITPYLIFVIFFTRTKFLENKIYTNKTRKLWQNTQKIANFLRYYGKIHSKLPIFRVKYVKIYTGQKKFTRAYPWNPWQIRGMV